MTGTNDVDPIYFDRGSLKDSMESISRLLSYLQKRFPKTIINVINILPRKTKGCNDIIKFLNEHIASACKENEQLNFVDTESNNRLFSYHNGFQKEKYFMFGPDNVHLTKDGIARLTNHLKHLAHT